MYEIQKKKKKKNEFNNTQTLCNSLVTAPSSLLQPCVLLESTTEEFTSASGVNNQENGFCLLRHSCKSFEYA